MLVIYCIIRGTVGTSGSGHRCTSRGSRARILSCGAVADARVRPGRRLSNCRPRPGGSRSGPTSHRAVDAAPASVTPTRPMPRDVPGVRARIDTDGAEYIVRRFPRTTAVPPYDYAVYRTSACRFLIAENNSFFFHYFRPPCPSESRTVRCEKNSRSRREYRQNLIDHRLPRIPPVIDASVKINDFFNINTLLLAFV